MASVLEVEGGARVEIDDEAGVAWLRGAKPVEYGQRYWDECLEYHNSPRAETLTRLRVELVARHAGPLASLVDVGIGSGRFLEAWIARVRKNVSHFDGDASPAAFIRGVDTNPIAQEWLRSRGLLASLVELARGEFRFSAVTLWDVFEHLAEPAGLLDLIPAGRKVFLSLPIYRDFRGLERSKHFKPGEHLSYWTHDGLVRYFGRHGYQCLESNDLESQAGRDSIRSYAFVRLGGTKLDAPLQPPSLLITNGIGDFLAAESFWPEAKRRELETVYYATRQWRAIRELLEAFAKRNFPKLKHHVVLWEEFDEAEAFCFNDAGDVTQKVRVPPGVEDFSIARVFPEVTEGLLHHTGSTALRYDFADVTHLELPDRFVLVCPTTDDPTPVGRNFFPADWRALAQRLREEDLRGVVLGHPGTDGDWLLTPQEADDKLLFLDLRGHTSMLESIEVLKRARGYVGIDSCLSVLAARLFRFPALMIKCIRPLGGIAWKHVYWYPRAGFLAPPEKTPFIGGSIAEIIARASQ